MGKSDMITIHLGRGILLDLPHTSIKEKMLATIYDFGIPESDFKKLDLPLNQVMNLYHNILCYRSTVKYLKNFKGKLYDS